MRLKPPKSIWPASRIWDYGWVRATLPSNNSMNRRSTDSLMSICQCAIAHDLSFEPGLTFARLALIYCVFCVIAASSRGLQFHPFPLTLKSTALLNTYACLLYTSDAADDLLCVD